jgi:hypothetical protein
MDLPIYWINVESHKERHNYMDNILTKLKYNHQRVDAVTPDNLSDHHFTKNEKIECGLTKDCKDCVIERCVLISHLNAIKQGLEDINSKKNTSDWFVIMEDDIAIPFEVDTSMLLNTAPKDAEVLQLSISMPKTIEILKKLYTEGCIWKKWQMIIACAQCYMISKKGAENLLKKCKFIESTSSNGTITSKYTFDDIETKRLSDVFIFSNLNTYSHTISLYYSNLSHKSTIHTDHTPLHTEGVELIKKIYQTPSIIDSIPYIEKIDLNV